jgi:hypothetical protein
MDIRKAVVLIAAATVLYPVAQDYFKEGATYEDYLRVRKMCSIRQEIAIDRAAHESLLVYFKCMRGEGWVAKR